jgi:hypothetical protein
MDRTEDLDSALSFVVGRIEEQAKQSGEPLNDEQRLLLRYPPSGSTSGFGYVTPAMLVPRNINLERVCALAKCVYPHDHQAEPASLDWEFAFAVFTLNRHSMRGLLQWLGMKFPRPKWDIVALIVTAMLPIFITGLIVWNAAAEGSMFVSVAIGLAGVATMIWMFFAFRRAQDQRLEEEVERCRVACRFIGVSR